MSTLRLAVCCVFVLMLVCTNEARSYRGGRRPGRYLPPVNRRTIVPARVTVAITTKTTTNTTTTKTDTVTTTIKSTLIPSSIASTTITTKTTSVTATNYANVPVNAMMVPIGGTVCSAIAAAANVDAFKFQVANMVGSTTITCVPSITCGVTSVVGSG
ncbi:hypothetical protein ACF0H5_023533 [Mactra antiquata]